MRVLVTGCAGFIGSNLTRRLLELGYHVIGVDNLSTGTRQAMKDFAQHPYFKFHQIDLMLAGQCMDVMEYRPQVVFHLAANADVRYGLEHPIKDIEQNIMVTSNLLEAMRAHDCAKIVFTSTGSVYGNAITPTPENAPFPIQTSLYATSKVAAEGLISSYCEGLGFSAVTLRLVSVLGKGYSHGHVIDFYSRLKKHPDHLDVLGDGTQRKSYMDVDDCVQGLWMAGDILDRVDSGTYHVFNLGTEESWTVKYSVATIIMSLGLVPTVTYSGGIKGWPGDNPLILLDCRKIRMQGWSPKYTIKEGILRTLEYLDATNQ